MLKDNLKLTSVKIHRDLFEDFKIESVRTNLSLQKLVNRAMHMFIHDVDFKKKIMSYSALANSGSL
jgi:hypothetical protein